MILSAYNRKIMSEMRDSIGIIDEGLEEHPVDWPIREIDFPQDAQNDTNFVDQAVKITIIQMLRQIENINDREEGDFIIMDIMNNARHAKEAADNFRAVAERRVRMSNIEMVRHKNEMVRHTQDMKRAESIVRAHKRVSDVLEKLLDNGFAPPPNLQEDGIRGKTKRKTKRRRKSKRRKRRRTRKRKRK